MDQLWAPWRMAYVSTNKPDPAGSCFVCSARDRENDRENLLVRRTGHSLVFLNRFPYNNGHLLIAPRAHKARLEEFSTEEMVDVHETLRQSISQLETLMKPNGFNVGLNLGAAAGAGLPGHLHWHIVPRWNGDTNFMPVISDVRVIVQSLDSLYQLLTAS